MNDRNRKWVWLIIFVVVVTAIMTSFCWDKNEEYVITRYAVIEHINEPFRIVHLSDLHNNEFGENNQILIDSIQQLQPDLVFMSGDMINRDEQSLDIIKYLINKLSAISSVYYGLGNHELSWEDNFGKSLRQELSEAGAVVLDEEYQDVIINGNELRIGGYWGYYGEPVMVPGDGQRKAEVIDFFESYEKSDRLHILIDHIPTKWLDWRYIDESSVDLVFSGHYHGGIIRFPLIKRGLFAPYVGYFPKYTKGLYMGETSACVLSAGLGDERNFPRLNNPYEIVVVDIIPIDCKREN